MMAHVEFDATGGTPATLVPIGPAFEVLHFGGLYRVGDTVGANLPVGQSDGYQAYDRDRDEFDTTITWEIRGSRDINGNPGAVDKAAQVRRNWFDLTRWFDAAPGKEVTCRVVDDDFTLQGTVQHVGWRDTWHGNLIKVEQTLIVPAGILNEV